MRKVWIYGSTALVLAVVGFVLTSGSKGTSTTASDPYGGVTRNVDDNAFHVLAGGEPRSCDPQLITSLVENTVVVNTCEGLTTWTQNGPVDGPQPGMAEQWSVSENGMVYTFHLRPEATWSNGEPLTAADFAWSWDRLRAKETAASYAFLLDEAFIESAKAKDDHTLEVVLSRPNGIFMSVVTLPWLCPLHRPTVEAHGAAWCKPEHFVGNGPYVIHDATISDHVTLTKNSHYYDAPRVELERIIVQTTADNQLNLDLYKKGRVDWLGLQAGIPAEDLDTIRVDGDPNRFRAPDVVSYMRMAVTYISPNHARKGFDDARVRMALSLAIDRKAIEDNVTRGGEVPTVSFIPPGIGTYKPNLGDTSANCTEAQRLLAKAGYPDGAGFPKYEFLYRTGSSREQDMAPAIAQQWKECLGIEVTLSGMEMKLWQPKSTSHDFDITLDGWIGDYPHPQTFAALLGSTNVLNHAGYKNELYDSMLAEAIRMSTDEGIQRGYHDLEEVIAAEMPVIPLYFSPRVHAVRPEWTGISPNIAQYHPLRYVRRAAQPLADK
ncbi:MAG: peptide ABC transporter substrate-binding protein [Planctomycetota bacterium]